MTISSYSLQNEVTISAALVVDTMSVFVVWDQGSKEASNSRQAGKGAQLDVCSKQFNARRRMS